MTDEQREEKNRKRREAYKRKQCHAHNKENLTNMVHQMNMVHPAPALLQSTNISTESSLPSCELAEKVIGVCSEKLQYFLILQRGHPNCGI
ncbi:hypothetical protein PVAP13_5NG406300 [Panicum virgatum]|uniref:Uncharacterized protein n=1 Tax=Panicum virgatum TaxID=38727 RepID=A0A8T0RY54_PANVG|nr:hypothetical protein PVAP13_5NG406300 [Panicum virgatum]